ncbi:hypothetical protein FI667_g17680, partial [Globisporangium splendens]
MDAASSHFTCTFWTSRHPLQERGSRRLVADKRSLLLCDAQVGRFSGSKSAFAAFRQDAQRLEAHGGRDDAAASLDVARVPCGRVAPERGPICSGAGAQPAGYACPKKGDVSKQDCHDNLPSYDGQGCVAKEDAVCEIVIGETWGCVFPSVGCSTLVPIPEPQCTTWDFDDHDLVANKGGNQANRLLESISFEASQEDYDESWFVQDGPIREFAICDSPTCSGNACSNPSTHNSKSADTTSNNAMPNSNSNNAVSSNPFSNAVYSDTNNAVSSNPFSNAVYSDANNAVSSNPFSNAVTCYSTDQQRRVYNTLLPTRVLRRPNNAVTLPTPSPTPLYSTAQQRRVTSNPFSKPCYSTPPPPPRSLCDNNAVSSNPFSNAVYSNANNAVSSNPFSNAVYSDANNAVSSNPFSNAVYSNSNYPGSYPMPKSCVAIKS